MRNLEDQFLDQVEQDEAWLEKLNDEHWEAEWLAIKEKDDAN